MRLAPVAAALFAAGALAIAGAACKLDYRKRRPIGTDPDRIRDTKDLEDGLEGVKAERVELGVVVFPTSTRADRTTQHEWIASRPTPGRYRLGYALANQAANAAKDNLAAYARQTRYQRISEGGFRWAPSGDCAHGLHCVYQRIEAHDRDAVSPIAEVFHRHAKDTRLSAIDAATLAITFIQEIRYEDPSDQPFGVLPPALVASEARGDCDSKSLFAYMVLARLGIDSVLISSQAHRHTMLGVALPATGQWFSHDGRRYFFVEMTAKHSPIGFIAPQLQRPNDWRVDVMVRTPG